MTDKNHDCKDCRRANCEHPNITKIRDRFDNKVYRCVFCHKTILLKIIDCSD